MSATGSPPGRAAGAVAGAGAGAGAVAAAPPRLPRAPPAPKKLRHRTTGTGRSAFAGVYITTLMRGPSGPSPTRPTNRFITADPANAAASVVATSHVTFGALAG